MTISDIDAIAVHLAELYGNDMPALYEELDKLSDQHGYTDYLCKLLETTYEKINN